jgi:hypothetical protein
MPAARLNISLPILGLATGKPGEFIDSRSTPDCQNVEFDRFTIAKRTGESIMGATAGQRILAIGELKVGLSRYVFRIGTTKFEEYDYTLDTWTSRANAALTGTSTEVVDFTFPILGGSKVLVYTNGLDNLRKWTGSGNDFDLGGTPPKAKFVLAVGPYLMLANITDGGNTYYSRVQWSDTGDIETWSGGNANSTNLIDDQQDITGLALYSDGVTVHKENCIYVGYRVSTSEVFRFDRRNTGVGTIADATIQNLPDGKQVFLSREGIHIFNGITAPLLDSDMMEEIRRGANPQHIYKATSKLVREKDEYWVALPLGSQTEPETVFKYNYATGQVYKDIRTSVTTFGEFELSDELTWDDISTSWDAYSGRWDDLINLALAPTIAIGHSDGIVTKRQGIYNDNGTAIDSYWISKDYTAADFGFDNPSILMRWQGIEVIAKGTAVDVYYSIDGGSTWVSIGELTLLSDYQTDDAPGKLYFDVISSKIRFKFANSDDDSYFALKQFLPVATKREARR